MAGRRCVCEDDSHPAGDPEAGWRGVPSSPARDLLYTRSSATQDLRLGGPDDHATRPGQAAPCSFRPRSARSQPLRAPLARGTGRQAMQESARAPPVAALHPDVLVRRRRGPVIVSGSGPVVRTERQALPGLGLAGLFVSQIGHGTPRRSPRRIGVKSTSGS